MTLRTSIVAAALAGCAWGSALAGPVDAYRTGPEYCPQDRPPGGRRITQAEAVERTRALLPKDFCGPTVFVTGCTFDVENEYDSWRVYAHQYKEVGGRKDKGGLSHTYLILDAVGNCLANIPGTEFGASK
jgi:hypothetical protein